MRLGVAVVDDQDCWFPTTDEFARHVACGGTRFGRVVSVDGYAKIERITPHLFLEQRLHKARFPKPRKADEPDTTTGAPELRPQSLDAV